MAIVDLPMNSMVIFHRFLYVYQRVQYPPVLKCGWEITCLEVSVARSCSVNLISLTVRYEVNNLGWLEPQEHMAGCWA